MAKNKNHPVHAIGWIIFLLIISLAIKLILAPVQAQAAAGEVPARQVFIYTPTPGPDGRIIYIVQANDTLLSISLISGVPLEKLKSMNNLTGDTIIAGQELLLGVAGPPEITITAGPSPTPTPLLPTATPKAGTANLCVLLFDDVNGDSIRQENEASIPGGAISVSNRSGSVSLSVDTQPGLEPDCFEEVPEGEFAVTVAVPPGYNATTSTTFSIKLFGGDVTYLDFGAQANSETLAEAPTPTGEGRNPWMGILGGLLLVVGVGFGIFASRLLRGK
jgi:LysM repeat protein